MITPTNWFLGVVEDIVDPQMLGRVRVRAFGYHTADKGSLPTVALPWATVMMPTTAASLCGIGVSPSGLAPGSHVVGCFLDGDSCQIMMVMGSYMGIPSDLPNKEAGFTDPTEAHPKESEETGFSELDEQDTNRLARNERRNETLIKKKEDERDKDIITSLEPNKQWEEPTSFSNPKYPYNRVFMSAAGHVIEIDDTPESERIHIWHKSGTHLEIGPDGTTVMRVMGQDYKIVHKDGFVHMRGNMTVTVEDKAKIYVGGDAQLQVDGNLTGYISGKSDITCEKTMKIKGLEDLQLDVDGNFKVNAGGHIEMQTGAGGNITIAGRTILLNTANSAQIITLAEQTP